MGPRAGLDILEKDTHVAPAGIGTPVHPASRLVTVLTELSQLPIQEKRNKTLRTQQTPEDVHQTSVLRVGEGKHVDR